MQASIIRLAHWKVDIKIVTENSMHVLQWRRRMTHDEVLLDGKNQQISYGLFGRETIYGLVFGKDEEGKGGEQLMFALDAHPDQYAWSEKGSRYAAPRGLRLETKNGPILEYGSLDEKTYAKPADFSDWLKKTLGMEW